MVDAPEARRINRLWLATVCWYVAGGLTAWSFGYSAVAAGDLWWHVATGRLMLERRAIPLVDVFSYSREGQPWLQHEWLSDLIFAAWDRAFGLEALVWWKWGVIAAAFVVLLAVLRRATTEPAAAYLGTLAAAAVATSFLDIRPHLQVYIEGRADTVFGDETLQRYREVSAKKAGRLDTVESSGARYLLWPIADVKPMLGPLEASGPWRVLYHDDVALLVERIDAAG